ncbi:MAG: U32 family peptidase, partial [Clostridia bacterium]|nr:U32 family peptidase [Clostridia bacterium]
MSKTPEILAPAGSFESVAAAVRCGADAVYFGGRAFNARRNAANFEGDEITDAVGYCHARGVKVYITLNTLASDRELDAVCDEIKEMCEAGADAFIIQDLGIASLVHEICPDIPMHASTQMTVNSPYGVEILKRAGFCRTVLPREFTEKEIKNFSENTDIELECFVHGALCMCLSGQCLMSSVIGGRSGNRGLCAQPCRLEFGVNSKGGNNLSLKDLSLIDRIPSLARDGVCSLKTEGRMKRAEYVAATVTACRNSREGKEDKEITHALGAVFSRSGFTSGYFDDKRGPDMFGIRTKDDVVSAGDVLGSLARLYDKENPLIPVEMRFTLRAGIPAELVIKSGIHSVSVKSGSVPDKAVNKEITAQDAAARLSKCGGTQFFADNIDCDIEPELNIPASALNLLRREGLALLEKQIAEKEKYKLREADIRLAPHKTEGRRKLFIRFGEYASIPGNIGADRIIIPLFTPDEKVKELVASGTEIAAEIPVCVFS